MSSDEIPECVRLEVRQRCGFGCVVCGEAFCHYEHFDPPREEFGPETTHRPEGITLLCPRHHDLATYGPWSKADVADFDRRPFLKQGAEAPPVVGRDYIPLRGPVLLRFGSFEVVGESPAIAVGGSEVLRVCLRDSRLHVWLHLVDRDGRTLLEIDGTDLVVREPRWDVRTRRRSIKIRNAKGDVCVSLEVRPREPSGAPATILVDRLDLGLGDCFFAARRRGGVSIRSSAGAIESAEASASRVQVEKAWIELASVSLCGGRQPATAESGEEVLAAARFSSGSLRLADGSIHAQGGVSAVGVGLRSSGGAAADALLLRSESLKINPSEIQGEGPSELIVGKGPSGAPLGKTTALAIEALGGFAQFVDPD